MKLSTLKLITQTEILNLDPNNILSYNLSGIKLILSYDYDINKKSIINEKTILQLLIESDKSVRNNKIFDIILNKNPILININELLQQCLIHNKKKYFNKLFNKYDNNFLLH